MSALRSLALLACVLATACGSLDLPAPQYVRWDTKLTDEQGKDPGSDPIQVTSPDVEGGWKLKYGDVIHLRRWSPGGWMNPANITPISTVDRIPLRCVTPGERLYDYEREFLANILMTNRGRNFKTTADAALATNILRSEVALWNALMESLRLKRVTVGQGTDNERRTLILTVNMVDLLKHVPNLQPDQFDTGVIEIFGFGTSLPSPYDTAFDKPFPGTKNADYYDDESNEVAPLYTFLHVDLNGVDFRNLGPEESQWTLSDVVASRICSDDGAATITGFHVRGAWRMVWLLGKPTHEFVRITSETVRARSLKRAVHPPFFAVRVDPSIREHVTIRDVDGLEWSTSQVPAHCRR